MLTPQPTRCLRTRSFSLRAGIAYADAYAGLRTPGSPGFCLHEVLSANLLLKMNKGVLDVAHLLLVAMCLVFFLKSPTRN